MFIQNKTIRRTATTVKSGVVSASLIIGLALASSPTQAASACKGLDTKACGSSSSCQWINGYERKDGRTVSSFCRTKAKARTSAKVAQPATKTARANSKK